MSYAAQFRRELDKLFAKRTHWLRIAIEGPKPGMPPRLSRAVVRKAIDKMQRLASDALARALAREEFEDCVDIKWSWHAKKGKGRGPDAKRKSFNRWFDDNLGPGGYIYVFWRHGQCMYVGKTGRSGRRISSHFEKAWFQPVTRLDIYASRGRRFLPALECLAIHRFQPLKNKSKAETRKWTRKCELCELHRAIEQEVGGIFRLREPSKPRRRRRR